MLILTGILSAGGSEIVRISDVFAKEVRARWEVSVEGDLSKNVRT